MITPNTPAKSEAKEPIERTDDRVHMYLREMRSIGLLSRQGEVAIAKRIEAGREAMIAGLCESPLTFQAVTIWPNELNDGNVFLHDTIDLEATYAGPDDQGSAGAPTKTVAAASIHARRTKRSVSESADQAWTDEQALRHRHLTQPIGGVAPQVKRTRGHEQQTGAAHEPMQNLPRDRLRRRRAADKDRALCD